MKRNNHNIVLLQLLEVIANIISLEMLEITVFKVSLFNLFLNLVAKYSIEEMPSIVSQKLVLYCA